MTLNFLKGKSTALSDLGFGSRICFESIAISMIFRGEFLDLFFKKTYLILQLIAMRALAFAVQAVTLERTRCFIIAVSLYEVFLS